MAKLHEFSPAKRKRIYRSLQEYVHEIYDVAEKHFERDPEAVMSLMSTVGTNIWLNILRHCLEEPELYNFENFDIPEMARCFDRTNRSLQRAMSLWKDNKIETFLDLFDESYAFVQREHFGDKFVDANKEINEMD